MPNSVLWVCLVAIWLFVLVPMVIKGRPEVRKRTEATLATRVINRGGRAMSKASSKVARGRHPHDADWVAPAREYRKAGVLINDLDDHADVLVDDEPIETDHTDTDTEKIVAERIVAETTDADRPVEFDSVASDEAASDEAASDEAESDDEIVSGHDADLDDEFDEADDDEFVDHQVVSESLSPQEPSRRGRGGYDPNADTRRSETRYRSRQRILLVVAVLAIASVGVGVVLGGIGWVATGAGVVLLIGYMVYLRRTVRIEERIRRQRSVRAARAQRSMQRRRIEDEGPLRDEVPEHLIRPGAVVLEIDDEHPVFDHLPPFQRRRVMREEPEFRRAAGE